jgi:hypothetical protein
VIVEPYPGFEEPREFVIPDLLVDPETGEAVDVAQGVEGPKYLRLRTSARQLQISEETRAKNVIRVWNNRNNVATWTLQALHSVSAVSFIYGELRCPSLQGEHLAGAERIHLSDTPLTRALEAWTGQKVEELANDLHRAMAEQSSPKDREKARTALSNIRELMRRFLAPDASGAQPNAASNGGASGTTSQGHQPERQGPTYGDRIDRIVLESDRNDLTIIAGTKVPLTFVAQELGDDGTAHPVRNPRVKLSSNPIGQFHLDVDGLLSATHAGIGEIWLSTDDDSVTSNHLEVWSGEATDVSLELPSDVLKQGEKKQLKITFETPDGPLDDSLIDAEVLDPTMGLVGRHGRFTAGRQEGQAILRVRFGAEATQHRDFAIEIGADSVPPPQGRGDEGGDLPEILMCGDEAPGTSEYPPEKRTVPGGPELPTIIEDPLFQNVVWINPNSKEAMRVRRSGGGSSGVGKVTSRTFIHFVALKCFDILKRLHVRQQIAGGSVTEYTYMQYAFEAEMECADFIDAAWDLSDELLAKEPTADV